MEGLGCDRHEEGMEGVDLGQGGQWVENLVREREGMKY